jgi:uncharacterized protein YhhL (DUF1145 family)
MMVIATIAFITFYYVQSLPLQVTDKGKLLILSTSIILFIHGIFCSVFDSSVRADQPKVPAIEKQMAI